MAPGARSALREFLSIYSAFLHLISDFQFHPKSFILSVFDPGGRVRVGPGLLRYCGCIPPMLCRTVRQGWTLGWDVGPLI